MEVGPVLAEVGDEVAKLLRRLVRVEAEFLLEQVVGDLFVQPRHPLVRLDHLLELHEFFDLLAEFGVDGRRGRLGLGGAGELAAVAAGGHPDAGEAVGGLGGVLVAAGAEELPQREHGLVEPLVDYVLTSAA